MTVEERFEFEVNTVSIGKCSERWAVTRGKRAWPGEGRVVEEHGGGAG